MKFSLYAVTVNTSLRRICLIYPPSIIVGDEHTSSVSILPSPSLKIHTTFLSHAGSLFNLVAEAGRCDAVQETDRQTGSRHSQSARCDAVRVHDACSRESAELTAISSNRLVVSHTCAPSNFTDSSVWCRQKQGLGRQQHSSFLLYSRS